MVKLLKNKTLSVLLTTALFFPIMVFLSGCNGNDDNNEPTPVNVHYKPLLYTEVPDYANPTEREVRIIHSVEEYLPIADEFYVGQFGGDLSIPVTAVDFATQQIAVLITGKKVNATDNIKVTGMTEYEDHIEITAFTKESPGWEGRTVAFILMPKSSKNIDVLWKDEPEPVDTVNQVIYIKWLDEPNETTPTMPEIRIINSVEDYLPIGTEFHVGSVDIDTLLVPISEIDFTTHQIVAVISERVVNYQSTGFSIRLDNIIGYENSIEIYVRKMTDMTWARGRSLMLILMPKTSKTLETQWFFGTWWK